MTVRALGYLGIGVSDVAAWRSFSSEILGAAVAENSDGLRLRFDDRAWRIGLVTVLCRSPISLRHLGLECERANAAQI
jgi:hypothetical protein